MKAFFRNLFVWLLASALVVGPASAALETGTYISDLVTTNPASGDAKSQGDDHIRLLKSVLQATIPYTGKFYEEGTFTPALKFGGAAVGMTYSYQTGIYTRVGNRVDYKINILLTAKGSSVGNATITGLPVAASGTANTSSAAAVYVDQVTGISGAAVGLITPSASSVSLFFSGTGTVSAMANTNFGNVSQIAITGTYFI